MGPNLLLNRDHAIKCYEKLAYLLGCKLKELTAELAVRIDVGYNTVNTVKLSL